MDPHEKRLYGDESHGDGWGFVIASLEDLALYKTLRPIYEDDVNIIIDVLRRLKSDLLAVLIHARAASEMTPINLISTHPIPASSRYGELYIVHNGEFNRISLAAELGLSKGEALGFSDTYLATRYLAKALRRGIEFDDIVGLLRHVKTAGNIAILFIGEGHIEVVIGSYYKLKGDEKDEFRRRYYTLYKCKFEDVILYSSSTLVDFYMSEKQRESCIALENGMFEKAEIRGNALKFTSWRVA